jgi:UDP-N-acetylglucosamine 1-carboxyvinyltransferase
LKILEKYIVNGGNPLKGEVRISGAKNAAVAIIIAALMADEPCTLRNIPNIGDVSVCLNILESLGASVKVIDKTAYYIDPRQLRSYSVPYEYARLMRASYYSLGALLGKFSKACVPLPGGCPLGSRPIDLHLKAFAALGAESKIEKGVVMLDAKDGLRSLQKKIYFDTVSVGATMNTMLAAVKAQGVTTIDNAAREPHVVDLANFLNSMGAQVMGAGTSVIRIRGVSRLHGTDYTIIPDQIEAGTFMAAAAATGGDITVTNIVPRHLEYITAKLSKIGVNIEENDDSVRVWTDGPLMGTDVKTNPHPGFPTDMQPQIAALLCMAYGTSVITERVWEQRFNYIGELTRMGASISVEGKVAIVDGGQQLKGAPVQACDLRAGAALIIAALAADGITEIENIEHIERGYDNMPEKLRLLGANIKVKDFPDLAAASIA